MYAELEVKCGADKLNRLILLERAANQSHWSEKISKAVEYGAQFKDTTKLVTAVSTIVDEMDKQANQYVTRNSTKTS